MQKQRLFKGREDAREAVAFAEEALLLDLVAPKGTGVVCALIDLVRGQGAGTT